jgi:two-component system response regulator WspF
MRIGIVNDMPLAREALRRVVLSVPGHDVAWLAADGAEAIASARREVPDLILMDLIMPGVGGVEATRRIMAENPCPILVVTSSVTGHVGPVYEAMGHGALDAVDTPTLGPRGDVRGASALLEKIATVAKLLGKTLPRAEDSGVSPPPRPARPSGLPPLVAIGASTGGPNALAQVLGGLAGACHAPVVLVQHVDAAFSPGLARWLAERSGRPVEQAQPGQRPARGSVLLAATNDHLVIDQDQRLRYVEEPRDFPYRPSVDVFFRSARSHWPEPGVAVLLTGMGRDGAVGLLALRRAGWETIAQDERSSVIWGMPRAAVEMGAADKVLPVGDIAAAVVGALSERSRNEGVAS